MSDQRDVQRIGLVCTYDHEADAAYIYLDYPIAAGQAERSHTFFTDEGMFNLDIDSRGRVLGLEVLA